MDRCIDKVKGINGLPPEVLCEIFSYLPQRDLLNNISDVCTHWKKLSKAGSLWREVETETLYETYPDSLQHINEIHITVEKLKLSAELFNKIASSDNSFFFANLTSLKITTKLKWSQSIRSLILNCRKLKEFEFIPKESDDMKKFLETLLNFRLESFGIGSFYAVHQGLLLAFVSVQKQLKRFSLTFETEEESCDILAKVIDTCPSIDTVLMSSCFLQGSPFKTTSKRLNLTSVTVHSPMFGDRDLKRLVQRARGLKYLNIETALGVSDEAFECLADNCTSLESIFVGSNPPVNGPSITGSALEYLVKCSQLHTVSFKGCKKLDDDGVIALVSSLLNLKQLRLTGCFRLTDTSLKTVAQNCSLLEMADFCKCPKISLVGVMELIHKCLQLKELNVSLCKGITDLTDMSPFQPGNIKQNNGDNNQDNSADKTNEDVPVNRKHCSDTRRSLSKLSKLNLEMCINLTKDSVLLIVPFCPNLTRLNLTTGMDNVDIDFLKNMFSQCLCLQELKISEKVITRTDIEIGEII